MSVSQKLLNRLEQVVREKQTSLNLSVYNVEDDGCEVLAKHRGLSCFQELLLPHNGIRDSGCKSLAESLSLWRLKKLDLEGNYIEDQGCQAIAGSISLSTLETLNLCGNWIGTDGCRSLLESPYLSKLQTLNVDDNVECLDISSLRCMPWDNTAPLHHRTKILAKWTNKVCTPQHLPLLMPLLNTEQHQALSLWTLRLLMAWKVGSLCTKFLDSLHYEQAVLENLRITLLQDGQKEQTRIMERKKDLESGLF